MSSIVIYSTERSEAINRQERNEAPTKTIESQFIAPSECAIFITAEIRRYKVSSIVGFSLIDRLLFGSRFFIRHLCTL